VLDVAVASVGEDVVFRIEGTKASMSSSTIECTRRCILLCLVPSNKYSGKARSVARSEAQDCGRKICTCIKLRPTRVLICDFSTSVIEVPVDRIAVRMMLSMTAARRGTLKWWSGSKRMTAAL
jgi:hypothetical protein